MSDANEFPVHRGAFKAKKGLYVTGDALITGNLTLSGGLQYTGSAATGFANLNVTEALSATGDIFLGGDNTQNIEIGTPDTLIILHSRVDGSIIPSLDNTYDLGSQFLRYGNGYFNNTVLSTNLSAENDVFFGPGGLSLVQFRQDTLEDLSGVTSTVSANSGTWSGVTGSYDDFNSGFTGINYVPDSSFVIPQDVNYSSGQELIAIALQDFTVNRGGGQFYSVSKDQILLINKTHPTTPDRVRFVDDQGVIIGFASDRGTNWEIGVSDIDTDSDYYKIGNAVKTTLDAHTHLDIDAITNFVSINSAQWATQTDITDLNTTVSTNSADWSSGGDLYDLTTTVSTNSAAWSAGGNSGVWGSTGGTTGGAGGGSSAGMFVTNLTCGDNNNRNNGITLLTEDTDEIQVDGERPVLYALVDNSSVRVWCQWEGSATEWTGSPMVSGYEIPRSNTTAIGGNHARRFEGYIDLDLDDYTGQNNEIILTYEGLQKTFDLEIAGGGPEVTNIEFTSTPGYSQDHYKDGDSVTFVVEFDTTDVTTIILDGGNDTATRALTQPVTMYGSTSATITTEIQTTLTSKQQRGVKIKAQNSLGTEGSEVNSTTYNQAVDVLNGPVITGVVYTTPTYPGNQTELKSGDTVSTTFMFDTTNVDQVQLDGTGDNNYASADGNAAGLSVTGNTGTGTITINTSLQHVAARQNERPIRARARKNGHHGQYGEYHTSSSKLWVNNIKPAFNFGGVTYPSGQTALKGSEIATVALTITNTDGGSTYTYSDNGRGELEQSTDPWNAYKQNIKVRHKNSTYNVSSANFKCIATRQSNGTSQTWTGIVNVANQQPTISIVSNNGNRMRSGGNDGTSKGSYTIKINSNQRLKQAPALSAPEADMGTFSYSANSTSFTTTMQVHDNDNKGTFTYTGLEAINIAGVSTNTITSGSTYELGGFKSRTVNLIPGTDSQVINVLWSDYNKLSLTWSAGVSLSRVAAGTPPSITGKWCISDQTTSNTGNPGGPITIKILDTSAASNWTTPSTLTIQEAT